MTYVEGINFACRGQFVSELCFEALLMKVSFNGIATFYPATFYPATFYPATF